MPLGSVGDLLGPAAAAVAVFGAFLLLSSAWTRTTRIAGGVALVGHALVAVVVLPAVPFTWDVGTFHAAAVAIASGSPAGGGPTVASFATFQALVYRTFGADPTVVSIVNGLLAVLAVVPARTLARRLYPSLRSTNGVVLAVLFLPVPLFVLTVPMRDALAVLVFLSVLAVLARADPLDTPSTALAAVPLLGVLWLLRPELSFLVVVATVVAVAVAGLRRLRGSAPPVRWLVAAGAPAGLLALPLVGPLVPVEGLERRVVFRARGGAAYLEGMTYDSWIDVAVAAPARALYFQFAPFPLHATSFFDALALLALPAVVVVAVAAYRSAAGCDRDLAVLALVATVYVAGVVGYGLVDSNFGTTVRHRVPFSFLLCVLAAPVFSRWERAVRARLRSTRRGRSGAT